MGALSVETRDKPVGIFDSGLGGLTVVKAMRSILPNENIAYFGDTARAPYGGNDKSTVINYAHEDIALLKAMNVKIIVAACGTVSSYLEELENAGDVVGVIEPTCLAAVNATKSGKIGVMATTAAINSKSYERCITRLNPNLTVNLQGCPLLVPLIEAGVTTDASEELRQAVEKYVRPLIHQNIDTLILGCTHYPIIKDVIRKAVGKNIALIDSGEETAKFVKSVLMNQGLDSQRQALGNQIFFVSGEPQNFSETAKTFLGYDIHENVAKIDINGF